MGRAEFERGEALARRHTVPEMRAAGYWSARCNGHEWQTFAMPADMPEEERRAVLAQFAGCAPQKFGGDGHG